MGTLQLSVHLAQTSSYVTAPDQSKVVPQIRPVARFQDLVGHNIFLGGKIFAFTVCLKQIFLGATKFGGHKKNLGGPWPRMPLVATGLLQIRAMCSASKLYPTMFLR